MVPLSNSNLLPPPAAEKLSSCDFLLVATGASHGETSVSHCQTHFCGWIIIIPLPENSWKKPLGDDSPYQPSFWWALHNSDCWIQKQSQKPQSLKLTRLWHRCPFQGIQGNQGARALGRAVPTIPCTGPSAASVGSGPEPKRSCGRMQHMRIMRRSDRWYIMKLDETWHSLTMFDIMYHHTWHAPVNLGDSRHLSCGFLGYDQLSWGPSAHRIQGLEEERRKPKVSWDPTAHTYTAPQEWWPHWRIIQESPWRPWT